MRRSISRRIRERLQQGFARELGQFVPVTEGNLPKDSLVYRWEVGDHLCAFVAVVMSDIEDEALVEIAWSRLGRWPNQSVWVSDFPGPEAPTVTAKKKESRFRLHRLWNDRQGDSRWSVCSISFPEKEPAETELMPKADAVAADIVEKTRSYAVPYFQSTAKFFANAAASRRPAGRVRPHRRSRVK